MLSRPDSGVENPTIRAREISEYFGAEDSYDRFRTHGRPIRVEELEKLQGLRVRRLENDVALQNAVLSIYHALDLTFGGPALKIVENHLGSRKVRVAQQVVIPAAPAMPPEETPGEVPPGAP